MDEHLHRIGRPMPNRAGKPESNFVARHAEGLIRTALSDTRIVALVGPRQSGKTTLARRIAERDGRPFVTLDDDQVRRFARDDPAGFMRTRQTVVIDEIQRAPDLILALMFLIRRIPAWHRSGLKRLVKAPKLMFLDSGLLAALRRTAVADVARDRQRLGPLLECFVHAELAKAASLCEEPTAISHYRDKDRVEVDLVLSRSPGEVVGIEVKAGATARPKDFRGLRRLQEAAGADFRCGILLHDGDRVEPVAPQLFAMPIDMLWCS